MNLFGIEIRESPIVPKLTVPNRKHRKINLRKMIAKAIAQSPEMKKIADAMRLDLYKAMSAASKGIHNERD